MAFRGVDSPNWLGSRSIPLPNSHLPVKFQRFFIFSSSLRKWTVYESHSRPSPHLTTSSRPHIRLVSWNVDAAGPSTFLRMTAIIGNISTLSTTHPVDIILLQEVSIIALEAILNSDFIRGSYLVSDIDSFNWRGQNPMFGSITLVRGASPSFAVDSIYRVHYPSFMSRDALCCDLLVRSPSDASTKIIRIINVHLESLPISPPLRPTQLSICADYLRAAGTGCVVGDFNAITPLDDSLAQALGLKDAWVTTKGNESEGHTWGTQIEESFPPGRLDRAALQGNLVPLDVQVLPCGLVFPDVTAAQVAPVFWSDHCGLLLDMMHFMAGAD